MISGCFEARENALNTQKKEARSGSPHCTGIIRLTTPLPSALDIAQGVLPTPLREFLRAPQ